MSNLIEAQDVWKSFGSNEILRGLNLTVPRGCVFALLGENGVGKTTLIRGLMGYLKFDRGRVTVSGFDPQRDTLPMRRRIGYVPDSPTFYEWMTVAETARFAAAFHAGGFLRNFADHATRFELPAATKVAALSKGMKSKLALALMLAADPELLILDEPTSGLDPVVRRTFLESMVDLAAAGKTVLIASHQIHEIERVADQVAFIREGQICEVGLLEDLKQDIQVLSFSRRDTLIGVPFGESESQVLSAVESGRTMTCLMRKLADELISRIQNDTNIFDINVSAPSLEDLYVGFSSPKKLSHFSRATNREANRELEVRQ